MVRIHSRIEEALIFNIIQKLELPKKKHSAIFKLTGHRLTTAATTIKMLRRRKTRPRFIDGFEHVDSIGSIFDFHLSLQSNFLREGTNMNVFTRETYKIATTDFFSKNSSLACETVPTLRRSV